MEGEKGRVENGGVSSRTKEGEVMKDERVEQRGQDGGWKLIKSEDGAKETEIEEAQER